MAKVAIPAAQMEQANLTIATDEMRARMNNPMQVDGVTPLTDAQVCKRYIKAILLDLAGTRVRKTAEAAVVVPPLMIDTGE